MTELVRVFESSEFGDVRVILEDGKELFVANDIAKALGYSNPSKATNDHCKCSLMKWGNDSLGRKQEFKMIPESDVFRLIVKSKLPSAERFEKWLFEEVLPSIRKNGGYIHSNEDDTDEEIMARALMVAQKTIEKKNDRIKNLELVVEEQKPLVEFADTLLKSKSSILIGDFAKVLCEDGISIGEIRLFDWLREKKYIFKENKTNKPYQQYLDNGLFEVKTGVVKSAFRDIQTFTVKLTPKGQLYFYKKLKEDGRFNKL